MVVSKNPDPSIKMFQSLLNSVVVTLDNESKTKQKEYLTLLGDKLEEVVAEIMTIHALGTPFESSIELISGLKFPDIIANNYYGVEVKTTKQNHWTTTGNSVLEGTRVDGIEKIFMLFGKMVAPIEFKCRPYEECLSEVVVTHSPRYLINMDLKIGETIFDKLDVPYEVLRKLNNPIKPITQYYRKFLKSGEEVWWMDQDDTKSTGLIIKLWKNLPPDTRKELMLKSMILFPEVFSKQNDKYNRLAVWLINQMGIVCPNIRDVFSASGQGTIFWGKRPYTGIPQIIVKMVNALPELNTILSAMENDILSENWNIKFKDRKSAWINLVDENAIHFKLPFNLTSVQDKFLRKK